MHKSAILVWKLLVGGLFFITVAVSAEVGVSDTAILLGQSAAMSGPAADLGKQMREGAMLYFELINRQGGVYGRKINLISLDDGYEPDRAMPNTRKLIDEHKVFALFGYVGTPTSYAVMPMITDAKIPFFAPFTGAEGLRHPVNKYIFNIRAGYIDETEKLVDWAVANHKTNIAVFYQNDSYGKAGLQGVELAMKKRKLKISALGTVERNTTEVAEAVKAIKKVHPDAIIMISAYKSCAEFIRQTIKAGIDPVFMNVSFVGSQALASQLGEDGHGVIISQVVPFPWDPTPAVAREFQKLMSKYLPGSQPSFNNLEGFIAAKIFTEALKRTGKDLTREKLITILESFRKVDIGDFAVTFTPSDHSGSSLVQLTIIIGKNGKFMYFSS
ncbi:MAG TPA: ABC transporter substrate-binding protein [Acidiferrobacterales bacterium]|nr:ABC transporter substrate-binding protein [Acidiferrobacterales bacterium]